jgi:hypothetical protein
MKKIIIVLLFSLLINKVLAAHLGLVNEESLLFYIPVTLLIIWWIVTIIRKNYLNYKSQISVTDISQESEAPNVKSQTNKDNEIPEFFKEKDIFGLDKPSSKVDVNTPTCPNLS